jgi:arabinogalactan endo-1,4-beta-galactosidase
MIVVVGGEVSKIDITFQFLQATLNAARKVPTHRGLGVFYWEPQGIQSWSHYSLNAWLENGQPSPALDAFKN